MKKKMVKTKLKQSKKRHKKENNLFRLNKILILNKKILKNYQDLLLILFIILFSLTYFYLAPSVTGLGILDFSIKFNNNNSINLEKNITSLKLSGNLEGYGNVKIYLNAYLVLDSNLLNESLNQGDKIDKENKSNQNSFKEINISELFTIQPLPKNISYIEFNDVCVETCNLVNPSNNLRIELEGDLTITITNFNYTLQDINNLSQSIQNVSIGNLTIENLTEELIQVKAEINKPVEWKLVTKNKFIELPLEAVNITVEKIINETEKEKAKLKNLFTSNSQEVFPEAFSQKGSDKKLIEIDESNETELEIIYYTKAPYLIEYNLTETHEKLIKNFTVKSDSELRYSNVLSYINLPDLNKEQIRLYHFIYNSLTNETEKIKVTNNLNYNLTFEDLNNNSLIDKLYFIVPKLSEQNFSLEISLAIFNIQNNQNIERANKDITLKFAPQKLEITNSSLLTKYLDYSFKYDNGWQVKFCLQGNNTLSLAQKLLLKTIEMNLSEYKDYSGNLTLIENPVYNASTNCGSFKFKGEIGDVIKFGNSSTFINISNGSAQITVSPENKTCNVYRCESKIIIKNTDTQNISFQSTDLKVEIPLVMQYYISDDSTDPYDVNITDYILENNSNIVNGSHLETRYKTKYIDENYSITLTPNEERDFVLTAIFGESKNFKYNVSLLYAGINWLIDPNFLTNGTDLNNTDAVYFNTTFNSSGFIALNNSALFGFGSTGQNFSLRGNYTSKILDANSTSQWINFSWGELVPFNEELVSNPVSGSHFIEQSSASRGFNMTGLVLLMHFNNKTGDNENYTSINGTVVDFSGNNNNGNASYGVVSQYKQNSGRFGGAFDFDEIDDKINISSAFGLGIGNVTVVLWVNLDSTTESGSFVKIGDEFGTSGDGYGIGVGSINFETNGNDLLLLYEGIRWVDTDRIIGLGWHHVAMTINDLGVPSVYLDGISLGSFSGTNAVAPTKRTKIGGYTAATGENRHVDAIIDELTIWNRTLSAQEIQDLYKRGLNLTFQVRSCDDSSCSGESFKGPDNTSSSYFTNSTFNLLNTSIAGNNRYFQYQALFERDLNNSNFTPELYNFTISYNSAPDNSTPFIFASPFTPNNVIRTNNSLNASSIVTDKNNDLMIVEIVFWNGTREHFRANFTNVANGTNISYTLTNNLTNKFSKGENWTASFRVFDGTVSSSWANASIKISNTEPKNYTINSPLNNTNTSDNTFQVEISNGTDTDSDPITYYLEIDNNIDFSSPEYVNTTIKETTNTTNDTTSALADNTYYLRVIARDNESTNGSFTSIINFTIDATRPNLTINAPINNTNQSSTQVTFNATASDNFIGIQNVSLVGNWTGTFSINSTNSSSNLSGNDVIFTLNITQRTGYYLWSIRACDFANNCNLSSNRTILIDNSTPSVSLNSPSPANDTASGDTSFTINYTVTDNFDLNLTCNISVDSTINTSIGTSNNTATTYTVSSLEGGFHNWTVNCFDDALNSNRTALRRFIVAQINVSSPTDDSVYKPDNNVIIGVTELAGQTWIDNVSLRVLNQTYNLTEISNNWSLTYTVPGDLTPREVNVNATGYNTANGVTQNVTANLRILVTRNTTANPRILNSNFNESFVFNNTNKTAMIIVDLDTLMANLQANITTPGNTLHNLSVIAAESNNSNYIFNRNYTYIINETGTYTIRTYVADIDGKTAYAEDTAISSSVNTSFNTTGLGINNISLVDSKTNIQIAIGKAFNITLPNSSNYTLFAAFTDTVNLTLKEALINSSLNFILNYTNLGSNLTTPSGQRRIISFDIVSNISFVNMTWIYDYNSIIYSINNESSIKVYYCPRLTNCSLSEVTPSLNSTENTVTYNATNLSVFIITETATITTTKTETTTQAVGVSREFVSLDIITPSPVSLYSKDKVVVPIIFRNNFDLTLNNIKLSTKVSNKDITTRFEKPFINSLASKSQETINLVIESKDAVAGTYDIDISADVTSPAFRDTAKLVFNIIEEGLVNKSVVVRQIVFTADLFKENPECLELKELLDQANQSLSSKEYAKALQLTDAAINGCKDLVTSFARKLEIPKKKTSRTTIIILISLIIFFAAIILIKYMDVKKRNLSLSFYAGNKTSAKSIKKETTPFIKQKKKQSIWKRS